MKIKKRSSEFRGRNWCAKAREYDELSLSSPKNGNYDNAIIVKDIIRGYLKGEYQIDEFPDLVDQGIEDNYLTDKEGEARRNKLVKLLTRACRSEKRKASFPPKKELEFEDYIVSVKPDAVFDDGFNLDVVLYRAGKPDVAMKGKKVDGSVDQCLELYFLLAYGKTLVPQGQSRSVRGSYYFLRKTTDSTYGQWDNDFFSDKGGNVVYLEDMHMGGSDMQTGIDLHFKDLLDKYYTGRECTEEECKRCCWNAACNYVKSPELYEKKENRKKGAIIPSDPQQAIIDFRKGIASVNAAAGSGKTECVTERGARMITEDHVAPGEMLFLTFTDAAAREMKERIAKKCTARGVDTSMDDFEAMTFNTFAYRIVRDKYLDCGFTAPPLVIDSVRNSVIITQILQDHPVAGLDYLNYSMDMPNCRGALPCTAKVFEIIKTEDLDPDEPETVGLVQDGMREAGMSRFVSMTAYPELVNLYKDYDRRLKEENLLQFADQEPLMRRVLDLYPDYLEQYGYKHIIVDEFQDSNDVQLDTIQRLTKCSTFESLMVVGDDSQSIYGFRHTSPENILHFFQKIGKTGNDLFLVENRRSTPEILELANKINALNKNRVDKDMIPVRESGKKPVTRGFHTKAEEYEYIGENIQKLISGGTLPEDIAFIAFKKTELIAMGAELSRRGIPWVLKTPFL